MKWIKSKEKTSAHRVVFVLGVASLINSRTPLLTVFFAVVGFVVVVTYQ